MRKLFEVVYLGFLALALICFSFSAVFLMGAKEKISSYKGYDIVSALVTDVSDVTRDMVFTGPIYYQDVTVTYQIADKVHTTTVDDVGIESTEEGFSVDDTIPIYVNNEDPTDVSLDAINVLKSKYYGIILLRLAMQLLLVSAVAWVVFKSLGGKNERKEDATAE